MKRKLESDTTEDNLNWGGNIYYLQKDTILFRIERDIYNEKIKNVYFAYFRPDFIQTYQKIKQQWNSRCTDYTSRLQFFITTTNIPLCRLPINNYSWDEPEEDDLLYFKQFEDFINESNEITEEEKDCF